MAENRERQRTLFEGGYAGITWPTHCGGQGLPMAYEWAFLDEAADFVMPDFGPLTDTTFSICVPTMLAHAPADFLRRFVPKVLAGDALVCQFFSEPSSGSDLAGARTHARRDGDEWVLNGQKVWSTFAHRADWGMCLARTDWDAPKHQGLTWFAVSCPSPGLTIRPLRQLDVAADFCEVFFEDVVVPDADRIGDVNAGWTVAQSMLVLERGAGRPDVNSTLPGTGPMVPDLVRLAQQGGRIDDPVVRQTLARVHTNDYVGRALAWRIGQLARRSAFNPAMVAYVKLFRGTYGPVRARAGVDIGGGSAMTWDQASAEGGATSQAYLNGRAASIAGGTNEMQRNAIAERVLELPREPSVDTDMPFRQVVTRGQGTP